MDLDRTLRAQDGAITTAQAVLCGVSPAMIARRRADGRWLPLFPHVYFVADRLETPRARVRGAVLWAGEDAVLAGTAAAWWSGFTERPPDVIEVRVPRRRNPRPPVGVRLLRRDVGVRERFLEDGILVTRHDDTVLDAAAELGGDAGRALLDRALQRRLTLEQLMASHRRRPWRTGAAAAGALLSAAADRTASEAERRTCRLLREAGISGWQVNVPVRLGGRRVVVDIAFPDLRLAVEIRGWAFHRDHPAFVGDPRRRNALVLAGWEVLEFTWSDLVDRPHDVVAEIRTAVARRSASC